MKKYFYQRTKQILSVLLALAIIASNFNVQVNARQEQTNVETKNINTDNEGKTEPVAIKELKNERTVDSNTYLLNNGMKKTVYYSDDIRYEEDGKVKAYNPELVKMDESDKEEAGKSKVISDSSTEAYKYVNEAGDTKQYLPKTMKEETPVLLTNNKYRVSFAPVSDEKIQKDTMFENKTRAVEIENQEVTNIVTEKKEEKKVKANYEYANEDVALSYQSLEHGIKEDIILESVPDTNTFSFVMSVENMTARLDDVGGGITFIDEDKDNIIGGIPAPVMHDAGDKGYSEDAYYELEQLESKKKNVNKYILKIVVDEKYLTSSERVYPVTIDPSVTWNGTGDLPDVYVLKSSGGTNYFSSGVKTFSVGKGSQGLFRSYIRAMELTNRVTNKYVESAKLTIYENGANTKGAKIQIRPALADFKCKTVTWNNQPGGTSAVLASFTASGTSGAKKVIDLTSWARNVAKGSGDGNKNYGLLFRLENESASSYVKFYGARSTDTAKVPKLAVTYYDGPTTASSVSGGSSADAGRIYLRAGESLKVNWSGISSQALNYVQYRIENASGTDVVKYSDSTKLGTTASGTKTISVGSLAEGKYKIYVRGVDKGGIKGTGKAATFYIDKTAPEIMSLSLDPAYGNGQYSDVEPEITWNVKETYLSCVQVSINNGAYRTIGTQNNDSGDITGLESGKVNLIHVRAVDKAGNISSYSGYQYAYDCDAPVIKMSVNPDTDENKYDGSSEKPVLNYEISDSTLKSYSLFVNDEEQKLTESKGSVKLESVEEGENSIVISAVDRAENESEEEIIYYRDVTNPERGTVKVTPKTTINDYRSALPVITWSEFTDANLKEVQVCVNNGNYRTLGLTQEGKAVLPASDFTKKGTYEIKVRAIDKAGLTSEEITRTYYYKDTVSEVDKYTPVNVYATEKLGGSTIIRFENKAGEYPGDIEYEIHRGSTPLFVPGNDTMVKTEVKYPGVMIAGETNTTYYYKVRAVTADGEKKYSDYSEEISSTTISDDEMKNRCGSKEIYDYLNITTPTGIGNIELSKGNFVYEQSDIMLPAPQIPIEIDRVYNSASSTITDFGYGWSSTYDAYISETKSKIYYQDGTKAVYVFTKNGEEYTCEDDSGLKLQIKKENVDKIIKETVKTSENKEEVKEYPVDFDSSYVITNKDNDKYYFNDCGRLVCIEESNGTFLLIECDNKTGNVKSVITSSNQKAQFSYGEENADGRKFISRVSISDGSCYEYQYEHDRMIKATHVGNKGGRIDYKYSYNEDGRLNVVTDAMGNDYSIIYGAKGAEKVVYPNGEYYKIMMFQNMTIVRKYLQNDEKLYEERYTYDKDGKKTEYIDVMENVSTYSYKGELLSSSVDKTSYYKIVNGVVTLVSSTKKENTKYDDNGNVLEQTDSNGNVTTYTYENTKENLKNFPTMMEAKDAQGNTNSKEAYEYDDFGNVIKTIDYTTNTISTYEYDENGNVTKSQETLVKKAEINNAEAEENGLLDSDDMMEYDDDGNTETEDSSSGTVKEVVEANYDSVGNVEDEKDNNGIVTEYKYDEFGRTIETKETSKGKTKITSSKYDENGAVVEETDTVGRITTYKYDNMGRIVKTTLTVGNDTKTTSTAYGYDSIDIHVGTDVVKRIENATVVTMLNENEETIGQTYTNSLGQTVRELSNGLYVDYTYDNQGKVLSTYTGGINENNVENIAEGKLTVTTYDEKGNATDTIINPEYSNGSYIVTDRSIVTSNVYDSTGMLTKVIDAKGNTTNYQYDEQGRLTKVDLCNGGGNSYQYDIENTNAEGKLVSTSERTTDALGRVSETVSNGAGQTLAIIDNSNTGNLVTKYEYDESGNKKEERYSDGSYIAYEYDEYNNIKKSTTYKKDEADKITEYEYDKEYKITRKIDSKANGNIPYRYTIYAYDVYGRQIGISEINSADEPSPEQIKESMVKYTYDLDDNITRIEYPNNTQDELKGITFKYNKDKWITEINGILKGNTATKIRAYEYYSDGKIKNMQDFYGFLKGKSEYIQRDYEYDVYDRVVSMKYWKSKNPDKILEQYEYTYDKNSNILSTHTRLMYENNKQGNGLSRDELRTYKYDTLDRLIETNIKNNLTYTEKNICYEYDKVGNRIKETETESNIVTDVKNETSAKNDGVNTSVAATEKRTVSTTYTYNDLDQLVKAVEISANQSYTTAYEYDKKGNQTKVIDEKNNTITENAYDVESQLTGVAITKNGKVTTVQENEYNGDGQRISKTDNGIKTYYFYEGSTLLYTTDENGNKTSQNIIGLENNTISSIRYNDGQRAYFYSKDIQGSTSVITDDEGDYIESYEYTDLGETKKYGNTDFYNEICYTSGVYDETTGLYYLNARYYDPKDGVFLSQDTYRGDEKAYGSWNLYAYCAGNPIKYVDPSGHWVDTVVDIGGLTYDTYSFIKDPKLENAAFVVVDLVCTVVPMFTCGGSSKFVVKRGFSTISKAVKKAKNTITTGIKKIGKRILSWFGGKKTAKKAAKKVVTSSKKKVNIELKYNAKWTKDQRKQAKAKVRMLSKNKTVKTKVTKRGNQTKTFRKKAPEVPFRCDVDHIIDLQLGGADSFKNMWFLDSSVNRSLGVQISNAIKKYDIGTEFGRFKIK